MAVDPSNYFAFWDFLLYDVVGDLWLVILLGIILIAIASAKWQLPMQVTISIMLFYLMVICALAYNLIIWLFVVLAVGLILSYTIYKFVRR